MGSTSDVILSVALFHKRHPSLFQIPRGASIAPFTIWHRLLIRCILLAERLEQARTIQRHKIVAVRGMFVNPIFKSLNAL